MSEAMEKLEMKKRLDAAMEWLAEERSEKASTAAKIFHVNQSSIRMRQHRQRHQERILRVLSISMEGIILSLQRLRRKQFSGSDMTNWRWD